MNNILALCHTQSDGTLPKVAFEVIQAAMTLCQQLGNGSVFSIAIIGEQLEYAANSVAECSAKAIYVVDGKEFSQSRYASDVAAVEVLVGISQANIVLAPATSRFCRAMPGACYRLNGRIDTKIAGIDVVDEEIRIRRWFYRQRIQACFTRKASPWMLLIDSGVFPAWVGAEGLASVERVSVPLDRASLRTQVEGHQSPGTNTQTIRPEAKVLFVAGAGWTKKQTDGQLHNKEAEMLILEFIEKQGASLGSSKSLLDQGAHGEEVLGFLTHLNQVGQTGSSPRHPKGLATCCHGEEPHVVGWRFVNERRAVNKDPNCGWVRGKADVVYVADAFEVMAKVNDLLNQI